MYAVLCAVDVRLIYMYILLITSFLWNRYAVKLKEAEVTKEEYIQKIKKLKERLSNILPTLNSIIQVIIIIFFYICVYCIFHWFMFCVTCVLLCYIIIVWIKINAVLIFYSNLIGQIFHPFHYTWKYLLTTWRLKKQTNK